MQLPLTNHINSSCLVNVNTVYKNGKPLFTNPNVGIPGFLLSVYQWLNLTYTRFYKMDSLSKLGWLASEILMRDSFSADKYKPEEIGLLLTNASSSLDTDIKYAGSIKDMPSPSVFVYTLPNIMIGEICIRNHFKGESAFFISEHFDENFLEQYVNNLLNNDIMKACICGWVELYENDCKAVLFQVEKTEGCHSEPFTKQNMHKIFETENQ